MGGEGILTIPRIQGSSEFLEESEWAPASRPSVCVSVCGCVGVSVCVCVCVWACQSLLFCLLFSIFFFVFFEILGDAVSFWCYSFWHYLAASLSSHSRASRWVGGERG